MHKTKCWLHIFADKMQQPSVLMCLKCIKVQWLIQFTKLVRLHLATHNLVHSSQSVQICIGQHSYEGTVWGRVSEAVHEFAYNMDVFRMTLQ